MGPVGFRPRFGVLGLGFRVLKSCFCDLGDGFRA